MKKLSFCVLFCVILAAVVTVSEAKYLPTDPCSTITCKAGFKCVAYTINCLLPPCPDPYAQCIEDMDGSTSTKPVDQCQNLNCLPGYKCNPVLEKCVPDPCDPTICLDGYECQARQDDPTKADCVEKDVCAGVICWEGWKCQSAVMNEYCDKQPCTPIFFPECVVGWSWY